MTTVYSRTDGIASSIHRVFAGGLKLGAKTLWCVEPESAALAELIEDDAVCIDIGGEYGLYSVIFSAAAPRGRTIVIEANPSLCSWLRFVKRMIHAQNMDIVECGVSACEDVAIFEVPLRRGRGVVGRGSVATESGPNREEFSRFEHFEVALASLDSIASAKALDRIDVIKADIEGMEAAMLDGATDILGRFSPMWLLEIEERHLSKFCRSSDEIFEKMSGLGYEASVYLGKRWQRTQGLVPGVRNYLFRRDESREGADDHALHIG